MKKIVFGIALLIFTTIVGIIAFSYLEKPFEVLVSPTGEYKVELYGNKQRPWFFTNTVTAKIIKDEKLLGDDELHHGDFLDTSFEMTYQKYIWVADNIISFRGIRDHEVASDKNGDSLLISNNTNREIRLLKIRFSVNTFLIFDLAPHSSQTIYINHSKAPTFIYVEGKFANGKSFKNRAVNFSENSKKGVDELFNYCASVENDKTSINSLQLEGYETYQTIIIPKVENCSQSIQTYF